MGLPFSLLRGGEEHAVGFETAHLARGEVGDDDDHAADESSGAYPLGDAGEYLAAFRAEVDFESEELVGFEDALGDQDFGARRSSLAKSSMDLGGGFGLCFSRAVAGVAGAASASGLLERSAVPCRS